MCMCIRHKNSVWCLTLDSTTHIHTHAYTHRRSPTDLTTSFFRYILVDILFVFFLFRLAFPYRSSYTESSIQLPDHHHALLYGPNHMGFYICIYNGMLYDLRARALCGVETFISDIFFWNFKSISSRFYTHPSALHSKASWLTFEIWWIRSPMRIV